MEQVAELEQVGEVGQVALAVAGLKLLRR